MLGGGLEPPRSCDHQPLKLMCLPFHHPSKNAENLAASFCIGKHYFAPPAYFMISDVPPAGFSNAFIRTRLPSKTAMIFSCVNRSRT